MIIGTQILARTILGIFGLAILGGFVAAAIYIPDFWHCLLCGITAVVIYFGLTWAFDNV